MISFQLIRLLQQVKGARWSEDEALLAIRELGNVKELQVVMQACVRSHSNC